MRTVMWAELRMHPRRVVSAGLAVLLGVAFVVAGFGATETMKGFVRDSVAARATRSDIVVSAGEFSTLPQKATAAVRRAPGVQYAEPVHKTFLDVALPDGRSFLQVMSAPADPRLRWVDVASGRLPRGASEVAIDSGTAEDQGLSPGDSLTVSPNHLVDSPEGDGASRAPADEPVRVVGVVDFHLSPEIIGGTLLGLDADVARWGNGGLSEIDVLGVPGTDPASLREGITRTLTPLVPQDLTVRTGEEEAQARAEALTGDVDVLGAFLLGFAGVAMLVAAIVISNTFTIILAQRTRQLALLRCVGATRRQIFRSVVVESLAVGTVAALLGIATGVAVVVGGTWTIGHIWPDASTSPVLSPTGILVAFAVGVGVTLLSALFPARRSTRVAPLAALRPDTAARARRTSRLRIVAGLLAAALGTGGLCLGIQSSSAPSGGPGLGVLVGIAGGALSLLGVLLVGPVLVPVVARVLGGPLRATGPAGQIAVGNAVRNPGRASATSTALLVGVCLMTMMTVGSACVTRIGNDELDSNFPVDMAVTTEESGNGVPEARIGQIAEVDGVEHAVPVWGHRVQLRFPNGTAELQAQAGDPRELASVVRDGKVPSDGTVLVSARIAEDLGMVEGQKATLTHGGSSLSLTLRTGNVEGLLLTDRNLARLATRSAPQQVWLRAEKDVKTSTLEKDLRRVVKDVPGASVEGILAQRATLEKVMSILLWIVTGLLGVALVIAVVGIGNTLSLSVLERTRESGVQRALGMTRRQLRLSLALEAILLAAVGTAIGSVLGIAFGWIGTRTLLGGVVHHYPLVVPAPRLLLICAVAIAAGGLASFLPSRKASRIPPTQALGAE